nr:hypothetical protein CISIN_1g034425mg [Ipomoea trifida]
MEICKTMLVFFLVSSTLLSALTASRNLKEISSENIKAAEEDEALMDLMMSGGVLEEKRYDEVLGRGRGRGRMNMETIIINDYSGTGANTHHDPKPPGSND